MIYPIFRMLFAQFKIWNLKPPKVAYLFVDDTTAYAISVCRTKLTIGFVHRVHSVCTQTPNQAELVVPTYHQTFDSGRH